MSAQPDTFDKQIAVATIKKPIALSQHGIVLTSFEDLYRFAQCVADSGLAPKGMDKPQAIAVAIQHGMEIGLKPMASLQSIAVINGRPGIYGDAALALIRSSGLLERYEEWWEVDGKELVDGRNRPREPSPKEIAQDTCTCRVLTARQGGDEMTREFSVADAKQAGLWGKSGPWMQYPKRMLKFRARGFVLRDNFGDVLKGLRTVEELGDIPPDQSRTVDRVREKLADLPKKPSGITHRTPEPLVEEEFEQPPKEQTEVAPVVDEYATMLANMRQHIAEVDPSGLNGMLELVKEHRANGDLKDEDYAALVKQIETRQAAPTGKHKRGAQ